MNRTALLITLLGVVISLGAKLWEDLGREPVISSALVYIGFGVAVIGLVYNYYVGKPYTLMFTEHDWAPRLGYDGMQLPVHRKLHRKGETPTVHVFIGSSESREEVMCDFHIEGGNVVVGAGKPFDGWLIVK